MAAVALTHVYTVLWAVLSSTFFLFYSRAKNYKWLLATAAILFLKIYTEFTFLAWLLLALSLYLLASSIHESKPHLIYMAKSFPLAFALTGFWIIPLIARLKYTTSYDIPWFFTENIMPPILWPFVLLSLIGVLYAFYKGDERVHFMLFSVFAALFFYKFASSLGVVDIRFLPFIYLMITQVAAYTVYRFSRLLKAPGVLALIVILLTVFWVNSNKALITEKACPDGKMDSCEAGTYYHFFNPDSSDLSKPGIHFNFYLLSREFDSWEYRGFIKHWTKWNYEGFELKAHWSDYKAVNEFLRGSVDSARAKFEHNDQYNSAGTVRAFESIPLFSGRSIHEGLYMQSSISSPYAFYIQSEVSQQQSCPYWAAYPCTSFDLDSGTRHLEMFNTRYLVATTSKVNDALENDTRWVKRFESGSYKVWELMTNPNRYVTVPSHRPVLFDTGDWKNISYQWFRRLDLIDVPIVFDVGVDSSDELLFSQIVREPTFSDLDSLPRTPIDRDCGIQEVVGPESIDFMTDCVGVPHIVSVSYYPTWKVTGARGPYLVSPSFMLVVPTSTRVRIEYSKTFIDWLGLILTASAVTLIAYTVKGKNKRLKQFLK